MQHHTIEREVVRKLPDIKVILHPAVRDAEHYDRVKFLGNRYLGAIQSYNWASWFQQRGKLPFEDGNAGVVPMPHVCLQPDLYIPQTCSENNPGPAVRCGFSNGLGSHRIRIEDHAIVHVDTADLVEDLHQT